MSLHYIHYAVGLVFSSVSVTVICFWIKTRREIKKSEAALMVAGDLITSTMRVIDENENLISDTRNKISEIDRQLR